MDNIMNIIFAEIMHFKQASQDKKITVGEVVEALKIAVEKTGLSDKVIIDLDKV